MSARTLGPEGGWCNIKECHDATEEDGASSNTTYNVGTEEETRHKHDRDNK